MKIAKLTIKNFRTILEAELYFSGHTLLIGQNNIGKSTICEAMDLLLGPDRLRASAIDEYDFYNAIYLNAEGEQVKIHIEGVLIELTDDIKSKFNQHLEWWHKTETRILAEGELDQVDSEHVIQCLRMETHGYYDLEEDEFEAKTYFSHYPLDEETLIEVNRSLKREFGFLYLRAIRTGSRALSLERGSLLDVLLRIGQFKPHLWEDVRTRLKDLDPPMDDSIGELRPILNNIEKRIKQYIHIEKEEDSTRLFVSQLTREHLRKTLSFFMSVNSSQEPVPFHRLGTGSLSTLVFALLSAIAEMKKDSVIFAMEEPEIAVAPHTQRRIVNYLLKSTNQSFITTHSPFVIEKFEPEQIMILRKSADNTKVEGKSISLPDSFKPKNFHKDMRVAIAEAILSRGVIVGEGATECQVLSAASEIMELGNGNLYSLDLSGVSMVDAGSDSRIKNFGTFFKSIGLTTFAFFDNQGNSPTQGITDMVADYDHATETNYTGIENLLIQEVPVHIQWNFIKELETNGELSERTVVPTDVPDDQGVRTLMFQILRQKKGDYTASKLISHCELSELPVTIISFLTEVYTRFPKPANISTIEEEIKAFEEEEEI